MADNVGYTPGTGSTIAADDVGGVLYQRVKITSGADGVASDDLQTSRAAPGDSDVGLLVRAIGEDNAYTQSLLLSLVELLRSVWQMGSAPGAASLTVRNATAADFNATVTVSGTPASNISQVAAVAAHAVTGGASPAYTTASNELVVAPTQQYHLPVLPEHLYFNIGV